MSYVLVVDDEPVLRQVIQDILQDDGYPVRVASGGSEMFAHIAEAMPALVLLDVMMPQRDGRELLRDLRAMPHLKRLPVIMMSAGIGPRAFGEVATGFLAKPFDVTDLIDLVTATIGPPTPGATGNTTAAP